MTGHLLCWLRSPTCGRRVARLRPSYHVPGAAGGCDVEVAGWRAGAVVAGFLGEHVVRASLIRPVHSEHCDPIRLRLHFDLLENRAVVV
jgi:hypothetical protein